MIRRLGEHPVRKEYFSTREVADMIKETTTGIDFWKKRFSIHAKRIGTYWYFSRTDVAKFHYIKTLVRKQNLTIDEAIIKLQEIIIEPVDQVLEKNLMKINA